jgi:hypothetical protein
MFPLRAPIPPDALGLLGRDESVAVSPALFWCLFTAVLDWSLKKSLMELAARDRTIAKREEGSRGRHQLVVLQRPQVFETVVKFAVHVAAARPLGLRKKVSPLFW